jgi:hypothetical protein
MILEREVQIAKRGTEGMMSTNELPADSAEFIEYWRKQEATDSSPYIHGDWVRVKQASDENQAIVEGVILRENGIAAELGDEAGVPIEGGRELPGLWIWVRGADLEKAKWVLWQWRMRVHTPPALRGCPKCGSTEIYHYRRFTIPQWFLGAVFPPVLCVMIWETIFPGNSCYRCGYRWRKRKNGRGFSVIFKGKGGGAAGVGSGESNC